ncbi:MAG: alpha/beta hydrolase [Bacteroidales bacterium]|nr:alpha/beta hydrolase [Bacteroidales bacterium]
MKRKLLFILAMTILAVAGYSKNNTNNMTKKDKWDKVFPLSENVRHKKVEFKNQYGITLSGDLYIPAKIEKGVKYPALAVCGPFGASKEQSSGLYAMKMAERGFITLAFDPSFTGESSGEPRRTASPDINTEDFMAAVDYLTICENTDEERIGIIGICGWGGIALNTAAIDTRIKAILASTMYDMSRVNGNGYFDADNSEEARYNARKAMAEERTKAIKTNKTTQGGGVVDPLPTDAPQFVKDYYDYYKTSRGYHYRSGNSNDGWHTFGCQAYANTRFLYYINEIRSAVLIMHGEKAHSRYFGEDAYRYMIEGKSEGYDFTRKPNPVPENKQLLIIPGASHCDLYDGGFTQLEGKGESKNCIPWDKIEDFFKNNLK